MILWFQKYNLFVLYVQSFLVAGDAFFDAVYWVPSRLNEITFCINASGRVF